MAELTKDTNGPLDAGADETYGIDPSRPSVAFVGRVTRQKGVPFLLRAMKQLDPSVQLVLCAGAADTPELGAEVNQLIDELKSTRDGVVLIEDWENNEFRALVALPPLADRYLYVTRDVDGDLLGLVDDTRATVGSYRQLEQTRSQVLFEFSLVYLAFALLLVAAAVLLGLWFASRLSRPIGLLAQASEQVGHGNLDVQVPEPDTGDEIQTLGQSFNRMTRQLKAQREELVDSYRVSDEQRRLFDNVLSSVTSGVIGLDAAGEIDFVNRSASRLLGLDPKRDIDALLFEAVPEFAPLFDRLSASVAETVQDEVRLMREGRVESLLVRMAIRRGAAAIAAGASPRLRVRGSVT